MSSSSQDLFYGLSNAYEITLGTPDQWGISQINRMFMNCNNLQTINNLQNLSPSQCSGTFQGCSNLSNLDLSVCTWSGVTDTSYMFYGCSNLQYLNISNMDGGLIDNISSMFTDCNILTDVSWGYNWLYNSNISQFNINSCPLSHESCLDLFNKLATRDNSPTLTLSSTTKGYMSEEEIAIATGKGWTVA